MEKTLDKRIEDVLQAKMAYTWDRDGICWRNLEKPEVEFFVWTADNGVTWVSTHDPMKEERDHRRVTSVSGALKHISQQLA